MTPAGPETVPSIFGFPEYLTSLALLTIVYSLSDRLYHFRLDIAPVPLFLLTYIAIGILGVATLATDLWFAEGWLAPAAGVSKAAIQALIGLAVLAIVATWISIAFVRPPRFSRLNCQRYTRAVYRAIMRGSAAELSVIAQEIGRSSSEIIRHLGAARERADGEKLSRSEIAADAAYQLLLLLADKRFCRHVASSSPLTAIWLIEDVKRQKKSGAPLGVFTRNLTAAALQDRDSALWHEESWYDSGLIGHLKHFTNALYGDWALVELLSADAAGPLDLEWPFASEIKADQLRTYCRAVLATLDSYATAKRLRHSYALARAIDGIGNQAHDAYKLNGVENIDQSDVYARLDAAASFPSRAIDALKNFSTDDLGRLRVREYEQRTLLDQIANLMFDLVFAASAVTKPVNTAWWVQYNAVWSPMLTYGEDTPARRAVRFKFRRQVYDEIKRMERFPNFKGAKLIAICLHVLGFSDKRLRRGEYERRNEALRVAVASWVKKHYLRLVEHRPQIAAACLTGAITFEADSKRLVWTGDIGIEREAPRSYLGLESASESQLWRDRP